VTTFYEIINFKKGGKPWKASNETEAGISAVALAEAGEHGIALQVPDTRAAKKKKRRTKGNNNGWRCPFTGSYPLSCWCKDLMRHGHGNHLMLD